MNTIECDAARESPRRGALSSPESRRELYVSVDVEASGPVPGTYSMLAIGACVIGSPELAFYAELKPINTNAVSAALTANRLDMVQLAANGREPSEVLISLRAWVTQVSDGMRPVCVGFNVCFDWAFLNWYFHTFVGENPFGVGALDIKAYYMGLTGCEWEQTRSSQLPPQFQPTNPPTHNALDDARSQAEVFAKLLETDHPPS